MTTETTTRSCAPGADATHGYCGRKNTSTSATHVTCKDCGAAIRADQHAGRLPTTHPAERTIK